MKILCITSRVPWPLEKGDKLRIFHQLKQLSAHHELVLFAVNDKPLHPDALAELKKYCSRVEVHTHSRMQVLLNLLRGGWNGQPFQVAYFTSPAAQRRLKQVVQEERPDWIYCQLIRTAEYRKSAPDLPAVLDYMDVFSKGVERRMANVAVYKRWLFRLEWKRLLRYEAAAYHQFNRHTVISAQDRDLLPVADCRAVEVVPNGVDTDYFHPQDGEKSFELLFNGNMNYPPNIESAQFLVNPPPSPSPPVSVLLCVDRRGARAMASSRGILNIQSLNELTSENSSILHARLVPGSPYHIRF